MQRNGQVSSSAQHTNTFSMLRFSLITTILLSLLALTACEKEGVEGTQYYTYSVPVYAPRAQVQDSIRALPARIMCNPGAIYARGQYLIIGERGEGYHIIDNSNPSSPQPVAFWQVPGSSQIAFVGDRAVSDMYGDIVVFEVDDNLQITLNDHMPNGLSRGGYSNSEHIDDVIVGYQFETSSAPYYDYYDMCCFGDCGIRRLDNFAADFAANAEGGLSGGSIDQAGSLSTFAVSGNYLYALDETMVRPFEISSGITAYDGVFVRWDIETAVAREGYLYLGSETGMHVLSLSVPSVPEHVAEYRHVRGCDPVAVDGNRAVVTVRDGADCGNVGVLNTLTVLDITDPTNPLELSVHAMQHPHGVAIMGDRVYVCEGDFGLRSYDFSGDRMQLGEMIADVKTASLDVIALPYSSQPIIFTISEAGMSQYAEDATGALTFASEIKRTPCR